MEDNPISAFTNKNRLQGPSVEVVVGIEDEKASWTIPFALLAKHSNYLRNTLDEPMKAETATATKIVLADREPEVFRVFVQWMYFGTVPDRFGLSKLSTGKAVSNSFLLWTLGDYLQDDAFKDRIMRELYTSYSLDGHINELGFVEFSAAEIDYCWPVYAELEIEKVHPGYAVSPPRLWRLRADRI